MSKYLNKCFLLVAALSPVMIYAQGGSYIVKGELSKLQAPAKVFFGYYVGEGDAYKEDSIVANNGRFEFKGTITEPSPGWIRVRHAGAVDDPYVGYDDQEVYVEKGIITVTGKDSIATATVTGGVVNKTNQQLRAVMKPIVKKQDELNALYGAATPERRYEPDFIEMVKAKSVAIQTEQTRVLLAFVKENSNSVVCLKAIAAQVGFNNGVSDVEPLFKLLTKDVQQTAQGKKWAAVIKKLRAIEIGATAPSFVQNDTNGQPVRLEDFRGKYLLIDFWASWCKPCRAENPHLIKAYNKYKDKNFTIVSISVDGEKGKDEWLKAIKDDGLSWTQLLDLRTNNEAAETYYLRGIPQNFLLDPQGKIIAKDLRGEDLEKKLVEILGKG